MVKVAVNTAELDTDKSRVLKLIDRAQKGDAAALKEVKPALDALPALWRDLGDIAAHARMAIIEQASGNDLLAQDAYRRNVDRLRTELAQPTDTALEHLLIERIVTCWLQLGYADALAAQNASKLDRDWADYYQRRIDRAHRRYLSAIKTLATVRRLLTPAVQVNVAEQQVNISQ